MNIKKLLVYFICAAVWQAITWGLLLSYLEFTTINVIVVGIYVGLFSTFYLTLGMINSGR